MTSSYGWEPLATDRILTDEMGSQVTVEPARRGVAVRYADSGESAPRLSHGRIVYIDHMMHDIIFGQESAYVRLRPENFYNYA